MKAKLILSAGALIAVCTLSSCGVAAYPGGYAYGGASYNTRPVSYGNSFHSRPLLLSTFSSGRSYRPQPSFNSGHAVSGSHSHGHSPVTSHGSSRSGSYSSPQHSSQHGFSSPSHSSHSSRPNFVSASSVRTSAGSSFNGGGRSSSSQFSSSGGSRSHATTGGSPHRSPGGSSGGGSHRGDHR